MTQHDARMTTFCHRVRSEYLEMPGLRLSAIQASRLWALDQQTSELILDTLMLSGFLSRNAGGLYVRASHG
ncbi:MAG: hypothetical protein U0Q11_17160 [Vicinamibacterales bacterium]